jgi:hypothetical protein
VFIAEVQAEKYGARCGKTIAFGPASGAISPLALLALNVLLRDYQRVIPKSLA